MNKVISCLFLLIMLTTLTEQISRHDKKVSLFIPNAANYLLKTDSNKMNVSIQNRYVQLINVPDVIQSTGYTCGPSSLSCVLGYYNIGQDDTSGRQANLAKLAGSVEGKGTSPTGLVQAATKLGAKAYLKQNMSLIQLESFIKKDQPVIVLLQAYGEQGDDYQKNCCGHYIVLIGFDKSYYYFQDPWLIGTLGYIPKQQFEQRWHDFIRSEQKIYTKTGIIVDQQKPDPLKVIIRIS